MRALLLLLSFQACDPAIEPHGTDGLPAREGAWSAGRGQVRLTPDHTLIWADAAGERALAEEIVGLPAVAGERVVWSALEGPGTTLWAWEPGAEPRLLTDEGSPDRPALSPDGETVLFFSGRTGLASLWALPFTGGIPTQITNQGLESAPRRPGEPPAGFVPPPHRGPPRVEGDRARWESPAGPVEVLLP